jgi:putative Mn2+ efflux pump MntP
VNETFGTITWAGARTSSGHDAKGAAMTPWTLLLLATGVSADAFAVALGKGLQVRSRVLGRALAIGLLFGAAQAVMPFLGWLLGSAFAARIAPFDHWVAFGLLGAVGGKMLWEALRPDPGEDDEDSPAAVSVHELLVLALATSIDALAVGVSFAFLDISIWVSVLVIGVTTFVLSFLAVLLGHRIGNRFQRPAEVIGGAILILIGAQIVGQHLGVL